MVVVRSVKDDTLVESVHVLPVDQCTQEGIWHTTFRLVLGFLSVKAGWRMQTHYLGGSMRVHIQVNIDFGGLLHSIVFYLLCVVTLKGH